ncbi:MAG TPA: sugar ABC transporter permease [Acidimicrobiales bacterium]|nr:sugar ABC transporter permease [Acidimicrobiales bacterium]
MTAPFLGLFAVFFAGPLIYSIILSLRSPLTGAYAGLLNYRATYHNGAFWAGVVRMAYFGAIQVTVMIGLAIGLALLLDGPYCRGRRIFSLVYFLPYAVPGVIAALMWGFLLEPDLDVALKVPHLLGLTSSPLQPLDYRLSLYSIMLIVTWEWTGYNMTILVTSLSNVPRQVLEAAKVDGASEFSIAARIKLPMIRRTIMFITILSIIGTLQLFNEPVILNEVASVGNALTPNQIIYNTAFAFGNEQTAAAQSVVLALITIVATIAFYGIVRTRMRPLATTRRAR